MTWRLKTAFRDFKRLKHITSVLFKQGMGLYVHRLKLKHHLFLSSSEKSRKVEEPANLPESLRKSMDELGPSFIKLGQLLSLRPDLIPKEYCEEFSKLQDEVSEISFKSIRKIVESELKLKLDEIFSFFDENPIASASIGQVHRARLLNGTNVVVKVQRPRILPVIEADIDILYYLANLAKKHIKELKSYNLKEIIKEFERYTKNELDYMKEGRNIDDFYDGFFEDENVIVPKVFWDYTTGKVLTMSYIKGVKIDEKEFFREGEHNVEEIADNLANAFLKQLFEFGFFHADPHSANVFVCKNNKIALLDYGIVGRLKENHKEQLMNLLLKLVRRDLDGVLEEFLHLGVFETGNEEDLKIELKNIIDEYAGTEIKQVDVPGLFNDFVNISVKYNFKIPKDFVLLGKAIITIEGIGQNLYPDFNLSKKLSEYTETVEVERMGIGYMVKNFGKSLNNYKKLISEVPKQTSEILNKLRKGDLKVELQHKELDKLEREIDRGSNRVALSVLIAALIVASSLILNIRGNKTLAIVGFFLALVLSLFLSASIYKERNIKV